MVVVRSTSAQAYEFACYSKACAPPPAGRGGSSSGGGGGSRRNGDGAYYPRGGGSDTPAKSSPLRRNGDGAYYAPVKSKTDSKQIQASDLKRGDRVIFGQQAKTVSSVGMQKNGKVGVSFTTGGVTDLRPDQTLPRPSKKVRVPAGSAAGKFRKRDAKYAGNPNNPANQQMHPDSKPPVGKIVRAPKSSSLVRDMEARNARARKAGTSWQVDNPPQWVRDQK